jgi:hypothetical protein
MAKCLEYLVTLKYPVPVSLVYPEVEFLEYLVYPVVECLEYPVDHPVTEFLKFQVTLQYPVVAEYSVYPVALQYPVAENLEYPMVENLVYPVMTNFPMNRNYLVWLAA